MRLQCIPNGLLSVLRFGDRKAIGFEKRAERVPTIGIVIGDRMTGFARELSFASVELKGISQLTRRKGVAAPTRNTDTEIEVEAGYDGHMLHERSGFPTSAILIPLMFPDIIQVPLFLSAEQIFNSVAKQPNRRESAFKRTTFGVLQIPVVELTGPSGGDGWSNE